MYIDRAAITDSRLRCGFIKGKGNSVILSLKSRAFFSKSAKYETFLRVGLPFVIGAIFRTLKSADI